MATDTVTHIHCHAEPGERQHTMTRSCWCHPFLLHANGDVGTIVDHNGDCRPIVTQTPSTDLFPRHTTAGKVTATSVGVLRD